MEMPEMDVVLPPFENPFYQPGTFKIPPIPPSSDRIICRGKRDGMECGLPKMYPRSPCANPKCSRFIEDAGGDAGGDAGREAGSWTCARIDEKGNVCRAPKKSARGRCSERCGGVTKYGINKGRGKSRRPKAQGVDEASVQLQGLEEATPLFLDDAAMLKSKKKRRNTKKRKHKKNHSKKKNNTKKRKRSSRKSK